MNFLYLAVIIIGLIGIRWSPLRIDEYMKKEQTEAVNGFFVLLVFFRHFKQYITCEKYDMVFQGVDGLLGQLIVVGFLFYSGFGIMLSIKNKQAYVDSLPKRFFTILIRFDFVVAVYLIISFILHKDYSIQRILLSFIGWESIGNSNWYIFAILCMYIITYICGRLFRKKDRNWLVIAIAVGCVIYMVLLNLAGKSEYWYNTILCFPAGMFLGNNIDRINDVLRKNKKMSFLFPLMSFVGFALLYGVGGMRLQVVSLVSYELAGVLFSIFVVAITLYFRIGNSILTWLGKHVFEIYVLQRIPMILLQDVVANKYLYFASCLAITLILAWGYGRLNINIHSARNHRE